MARNRHGPKTEALSLRLDPKSRFMLEFIARMRGQSITTVVERALHDAAVALRDEGKGRWEDFWDVNEGVRTLKLLSDKANYPTFEEDEIVVFSRNYWPFFYMGTAFEYFRPDFIDVLWPRIQDWVLLWRETKATRPNRVAKAMADALQEAGLTPPRWPPEPADDLDPPRPF